MNTALTREQAEVLVALLEGLRANPQQFVGANPTPENVRFFLKALNVFCSVLSGTDGSVFQKIAGERGWKNTPRGLLPGLRAASLSEEEVIVELVTIEIEAYKEIYNLQV